MEDLVFTEELGFGFCYYVGEITKGIESLVSAGVGWRGAAEGKGIIMGGFVLVMSGVGSKKDGKRYM